MLCNSLHSECERPLNFKEPGLAFRAVMTVWASIAGFFASLQSSCVAVVASAYI